MEGVRFQAFVLETSSQLDSSQIQMNTQAEPVLTSNQSSTTFASTHGTCCPIPLPDTEPQHAPSDMLNFAEDDPLLHVSDLFFQDQMSSEAYLGTLNSWLFEPESDISPPNNIPVQRVYNVEPNFASTSVALTQQDTRGTVTEQTSSTTRTIVSPERVAQVQRCWPSKASDKWKAMPDLWKALLTSDGRSLFGSEEPAEHQTVQGDSNETQTQWGFDQSCWNRTMNVLNQCSSSHVAGRVHVESQATSRSPTTRHHSPPNGRSTNAAQLPPLEIFDIGLDVFFAQFLPAIPILHVPTFAAKSCSTTLLLAISALAFNALKTKGANRFMAHMFSVSSVAEKIVCPMS